MICLVEVFMYVSGPLAVVWGNIHGAGGRCVDQTDSSLLCVMTDGEDGCMMG